VSLVEQHLELFMHLSFEIHVLDPHAAEPATFRVLKPPAKPLTHCGGPGTRFESNSARSKLEYENPDLTRPSVSSF
jgi:hypothetical protein